MHVIYILCATRTRDAGWCADIFQLEAGEILLAERVDSNAGRPLACDCAAIPSEFGSQLTKRDWRSLDFVAIWSRRHALKIRAIRQSVKAVAASPEDATLLGLSPEAPVLQTLEIYESDRGAALAAFLSYYHPARVELHSRYQWRQ